MTRGAGISRRLRSLETTKCKNPQNASADFLLYIIIYFLKMPLKVVFVLGKV